MVEKTSTDEQRHRCWASGCKTEVVAFRLMCKPHWSMVPDDLQREIVEAVQGRSELIDPTWVRFRRAMCRAIHHVGIAEREDVKPDADAWLEKMMAYCDGLEVRLEQQTAWRRGKVCSG